MNNHKKILLLALAVSLQASAQTPAHVEFATVESRNPSRTIVLPAELAPFLQADIEARVPGSIEPKRIKARRKPRPQASRAPLLGCKKRRRRPEPLQVTNLCSRRRSETRP